MLHIPFFHIFHKSLSQVCINFFEKALIPNKIVLVTWQASKTRFGCLGLGLMWNLELPPKIKIFTKCLIGLHDLGSAPPAIFSSWPSLEPTLVPETPSLLLIWLSLSGQITLLARQHDYHFQFPAYDHFSTVQTNPRHIDVKPLHHCARPIRLGYQSSAKVTFIPP